MWMLQLKATCQVEYSRGKQTLMYFCFSIWGCSWVLWRYSEFFSSCFGQNSLSCSLDKGLDGFGPWWLIHAGCFRLWLNPTDVSAWMVMANVRGCKQRWIAIGQGLRQHSKCDAVVCSVIGFPPRIALWGALLSRHAAETCCLVPSFKHNVGASSCIICRSWSVLQIYALKCLADSLCKSRQAHTTLTFKSMAWKSASETHCEIPYPGLSWVASASSSDPPRHPHKYDLRNQLANSHTFFLYWSDELFSTCSWTNWY